MARIVIELTNRCQLRCQHCFDERHAATGELPWRIIETVLQEGKGCGIEHLAFTGRDVVRRELVGKIVDAYEAAPKRGERHG